MRHAIGFPERRATQPILARRTARRRDLSKALDPESRFQAVGYDYLAEEGPELVLEPIRRGREYDYNTLPADLTA